MARLMRGASLWEYGTNSAVSSSLADAAIVWEAAKGRAKAVGVGGQRGPGRPRGRPRGPAGAARRRAGRAQGQNSGGRPPAAAQAAGRAAAAGAAAVRGPARPGRPPAALRGAAQPRRGRRQRRKGPARSDAGREEKFKKRAARLCARGSGGNAGGTARPLR